MSRWKCRAATPMDLSNRSNTLSEISSHGLTSKSKRPSIRKQWPANIKRRTELPMEEHFIILEPIVERCSVKKVSLEIS